MRIVLPCGKAKKVGLHHAADLYTGSLFRAGLKWALSVAPVDAIRILSAKHGFIRLDARIEFYDVRFGGAGQISTDALKATAHRECIDIEPDVLVLGGRDYFERVLTCNAQARRVLPEGYGLGKQIQWLTRNRGKLPQ